MNADLNGLHILSVLVAWLFFFDDKVDHSDGELFGTQEQFQGLAKHALDFVAHTLGLNDGYQEPVGGLDDFVGLFRPIGEALQQLDKGTYVSKIHAFPVPLTSAARTCHVWDGMLMITHWLTILVHKKRKGSSSSRTLRSTFGA